MARINIEDKLLTDTRFFNLSLTLGSRARALGELILAWSQAQKFYLKNGGYIPEKVWVTQCLSDEIINVGLATKSEKGIYLKGTEEHFSWLKQRSEAGKHRNRLQKKSGLEIIEDSSQRPLTTVERTLNGRQPLYSLLFTHNTNNTYTSDSVGSEDPHLADAKAHESFRLVEVWNQYCGTLSKAQKINLKTKAGQKRVRLLRERWRENPDAEFWIDIVKKVAASEFCNGGRDRTGWKATFDWLLKPDTYLKILEGNYTSGKNSKPVEIFYNEQY